MAETINGHGKRVDRWVGIIQSLGVPTVFMLFVLGLVYRYVPPVIDAHVETLTRTTETLRSMDATLKQIKQTEARQEEFLRRIYGSDYPPRLSADAMEASNAN